MAKECRFCKLDQKINILACLLNVSGGHNWKKFIEENFERKPICSCCKEKEKSELKDEK